MKKIQYIWDDALWTELKSFYILLSNLNSLHFKVTTELSCVNHTRKTKNLDNITRNMTNLYTAHIQLYHTKLHNKNFHWRLKMHMRNGGQKL